MPSTRMKKFSTIMRNPPLLLLILLIPCLNDAVAQNNRLSDYNKISWYNYFGTFNTGKKTGIHTELQWRRTPGISSGQQTLIRIGFNYQAAPRVQLRTGYAYIITYAYGDIPINAFGKDFREHRCWQMVTLRDQIGKAELSHRFMLEQRWVGRYSSPDLDREDSYVFRNRLRYMIRSVWPLNKKGVVPKTPYLAFYEEVMIGFGKNVDVNVFDQNRLGILAGYVFSKNFRIEAGFLNQIQQFGRTVNNKAVFQYNSGPVVNLMVQTDLFRKQ